MRKYDLKINNKPYSVLVKKFSADLAEMEVNGKTYSIDFNESIDHPSLNNRNDNAKSLQSKPAVKLVNKPAVKPSTTKPQSPVAQPIEIGDKAILAPIPGAITEIKVNVKDSIKKGQVVMRMEAMKMENEIFSNSEGIVEAIDVSVGDAVSQGQCLLRIS
ncbi:hypothetical protein KJ966_31415 [bacterium]|nr:hypothetical protein [bacterium]